jgi:hypothetical protein
LPENCVDLPEKVTLIIPQPQAAEMYYEKCGIIKQHNLDRQVTLDLEKLVTPDWSKCVALAILSIYIVNA